MMDTVLVTVTVALAAVYVFRRFIKNAGKCADCVCKCPSCSGNSAGKGETEIPLTDSGSRSSKKRRQN